MLFLAFTHTYLLAKAGIEAKLVQLSFCARLLDHSHILVYCPRAKDDRMISRMTIKMKKKMKERDKKTYLRHKDDSKSRCCIVMCCVQSGISSAPYAATRVALRNPHVRVRARGANPRFQKRTQPRLRCNSSWPFPSSPQQSMTSLWSDGETVGAAQRCHLRSVADHRSTVNEKIYGQNGGQKFVGHLDCDFSPHRAWDGFKSYTVHILTFSGKLCFGKPRNHIVHCCERFVLRVTRITKFFFCVLASEPVGRNLRSNGEIYGQKLLIFDEIYGQGFWRCGNAARILLLILCSAGPTVFRFRSFKKSNRLETCRLMRHRCERSMEYSPCCMKLIFQSQTFKDIPNRCYKLQMIQIKCLIWSLKSKPLHRSKSNSFSTSLLSHYTDYHFYILQVAPMGV